MKKERQKSRGENRWKYKVGEGRDRIYTDEDRERWRTVVHCAQMGEKCWSSKAYRC
jgi:hypothetical protein